MITPLHEGAKIEGGEDAGRYFRYMAEFVGFTSEDTDAIRQSKPMVEKHLPEIIDKFYAHLLRYPPTRKFFLKKDGSVDQAYLELRMRHQANFWLRTADANFDDDYARYLDYVGRAHTSRGADPQIYIAERYVIGQVGFVSHAISEALTKELRHVDEDFELRAIEAWNKLMMIVLELLARAYAHEREAETFDPLVKAEESDVARLADEAFHLEHDKGVPVPRRQVRVATVQDIPEGERKIIQVEGLSIGVFHFQGNWYALHNTCLHRGGPVCLGALENGILTCPWHGFQYNLITGQLLEDPSARLDSYPVLVREGDIYLLMPTTPNDSGLKAEPIQPKAEGSTLKENEFRVGEVSPGTIKQVQVNGKNVAVYNVGGTFFATMDACTHRNNPLSEGDLDGQVVTCFYHGSQFDVTTGHVLRGPAERPLETYRVIVEGDIGHVETNNTGGS